MIYLDHGATSMEKPVRVARAMERAVRMCGNPGRGGHRASMEGARTVFHCRELAARLFECDEDRVVFTSNCTHGLNIAIGSLVKPGSRVLISGFEHNAVTRPLAALGVRLEVAGRRLFDPDDTLQRFEDALRRGVDVAVFTHASNVFGYVLPIKEMAALCRQYGVPFVIDAAQSAGTKPVSLRELGASYIAMPGHKGLLGPQGTGILLCGDVPKPLLYGGTGTASQSQQMPEELPERLEAGTVNVPGIAGLAAGMEYVLERGVDAIGQRQARVAGFCARELARNGVRVFAGPGQGGTVSFAPKMDCETMAQKLAERGIAVRAGLHCAPLAHESAGTLESGTVRASFGHNAEIWQAKTLIRAVLELDVM